MYRDKKLAKSFTEGPLFFKIIAYAVPIMLTSILQTLYNMADHIVVGQFSGDTLALAAVGSTGSLTSLLVNLLIGISAGTGVVVAQSYGAKHYDMVSRATHTSIAFSLLGGIVFMIIGILIAEPALVLMNTKPELLSRATLYIRIIFCGIPASAVYNFSAATLRSVGDSKTPLIILSSAGILNVLFNLFFVIVCKMSVAGVAIATIISQYASAVAVLAVLIKRKDQCYAFSFSKARIDPLVLKRVLRFGVPAGIQGSMFSISNVLLSAASNTFSTVDISAKTIIGNLDGICYNAMNSYTPATMTVVAQNYGARKPERINKSFLYCLLQVAVLGITLGQLLILVGNPVMSLFIDPADPNKDILLEKAFDLLSFMLSVYFLCGIMEMLSCALRGLGYSMTPMIISLCGICGIRILWIYTFFPMEQFNTMKGLFYAYPVSWGLSILALSITCIIAWRRLGKLFVRSEPALEKSVNEAAI